jgi:hypothetical protein
MERRKKAREEDRVKEREKIKQRMANREGRDGVERRDREDREWLRKDSELTDLREERAILSKKLALAITAFWGLAASLNDKKKTESRAWTFYDDGRLTSQKGGDLLWKRSEFLVLPPVVKGRQVISFATPDTHHIYVTEEEGRMLHRQFRTLCGIPEDLEWSYEQMTQDPEVVLSLEELYDPSYVAQPSD